MATPTPPGWPATWNAPPSKDQWQWWAKNALPARIFELPDIGGFFAPEGHAPAPAGENREGGEVPQP